MVLFTLNKADSEYLSEDPANSKIRYKNVQKSL